MRASDQPSLWKFPNESDFGRYLEAAPWAVATEIQRPLPSISMQNNLHQGRWPRCSGVAFRSIADST